MRVERFPSYQIFQKCSVWSQMALTVSGCFERNSSLKHHQEITWIGLLQPEVPLHWPHFVTGSFVEWKSPLSHLSTDSFKSCDEQPYSFFWNKRRHLQCLFPGNMLFTIKVAVSADYVKQKGILAGKKSLIPRRMSGLPLRSPVMLISWNKGEHWGEKGA